LVVPLVVHLRCTFVKRSLIFAIIALKHMYVMHYTDKNGQVSSLDDLLEDTVSKRRSG